MTYKSQSEKIPYYSVKNGNGFWEPKHRMLKLGFKPVACGPDGDRARARAREWNDKWQEVKAASRGISRDTSEQRGYVYFLRTSDRVKIGFSKNPFTRVASVRCGLSQKVESLLAVHGTKADERWIHQRFSAFRQSGEWFVASAAVLKFMYRTLAFRKIDRLDGVDDAVVSGEQFALVGMPGGAK